MLFEKKEMQCQEKKGLVCGDREGHSLKSIDKNNGLIFFLYYVNICDAYKFIYILFDRNRKYLLACIPSSI